MKRNELILFTLLSLVVDCVRVGPCIRPRTSSTKAGRTMSSVLSLSTRHWEGAGSILTGQKNSPLKKYEEVLYNFVILEPLE